MASDPYDTKLPEKVFVIRTETRSFRIKPIDIQINGSFPNAESFEIRVVGTARGKVSRIRKFSKRQEVI